MEFALTKDKLNTLARKGQSTSFFINNPIPPVNTPERETWQPTLESQLSKSVRKPVYASGRIIGIPPNTLHISCPDFHLPIPIQCAIAVAKILELNQPYSLDRHSDVQTAETANVHDYLIRLP